MFTKQIFLLLVIFPLMSCRADDEKFSEVAPVKLESECGIREILLRSFPKFRTSFYYYDGEQIFGVFLDPENPTRILLVAIPDGSIVEWTYRENGRIKQVTRDPNRYLAVFRDPKTNAPTGESYVCNIGIFLTVPKNSKLELKFRIRQMMGEWSMTASRSKKGKWTGTMRKIFSSGVKVKEQRDGS